MLIIIYRMIKKSFTIFMLQVKFGVKTHFSLNTSILCTQRVCKWIRENRSFETSKATVNKINPIISSIFVGTQILGSTDKQNPL